MVSSIPPREPQGKFRIKGVAYRTAIPLYERLVPGGFYALVNALEPPLADFITQRFLASAWYDVFPFPRVDEAAASLSRLPFEDFVRRTARIQAEEELNGIYRAFIRMMSAHTVGTILPRLSAQFYDFGKIETRADLASGVTVIRRGVPRELATWLNLVGDEYLTVALALCGVADVASELVRIEPDGRLDGIELVQLEIKITWTPHR